MKKKKKRGRMFNLPAFHRVKDNWAHRESLAICAFQTLLEKLDVSANVKLLLNVLKDSMKI